MTAEPAAAPGAPVDAFVLSARGIRKSFSGVEVLHGVDFTLRRGEVHGLVGQNGAGKSTLVKIINGAYSGDAGEVEVNGALLTRRVPGDARRHGVAMVYQEFSLIPSMPVGQNILLSREPKARTGLIDDREVRRQAKAALARLGSDIDPDTPRGGAAGRVAPARRDREGHRPGRQHPDPRRADRVPGRGRDRRPDGVGAPAHRRRASR